MMTYIWGNFHAIENYIFGNRYPSANQQNWTTCGWAPVANQLFTGQFLLAGHGRPQASSMVGHGKNEVEEYRYEIIVRYLLMTIQI